jgi:hypothetical protein
MSASLQIPRGGPPRSIVIPDGKQRSREGSIYVVPGGMLHGLTDDEIGVVRKVYAGARTIATPIKSEVSAPPEQTEEQAKEAAPKEPSKPAPPRAKRG